MYKIILSLLFVTSLQAQTFFNANINKVEANTIEVNLEDNNVNKYRLELANSKLYIRQILSPTSYRQEMLKHERNEKKAMQDLQKMMQTEKGGSVGLPTPPIEDITKEVSLVEFTEQLTLHSGSQIEIFGRLVGPGRLNADSITIIISK